MDPSSSNSVQAEVPTKNELDADERRSGDEMGEEYIKKCLQDADELKQEGTGYFKEQRWEQALATYRSALSHLPKRVKKASEMETEGEKEGFGGTDTGDKDNSGEEQRPSDDEKKEEREEKEEEEEPLRGVYLELAKARSVLNANIGACYVKLEEYKKAVTACTEALVDDPNYIKALQRRATCNEKIGSWASLSSAQDDYTKLLEILPSDSPLIGPIRRASAQLKPRIEEAQKKETADVLQKLKGIGNSILGNFGLSTDNFKFEPNGQGGYSMNFVQ